MPCFSNEFSTQLTIKQQQPFESLNEVINFVNSFETTRNPGHCASERDLHKEWQHCRKKKQETDHGLRLLAIKKYHTKSAFLTYQLRINFCNIFRI